MQKQTPLVSVSMISYNAQDFIAEAIEGVLRQKVDFTIELVIGDDCSQDRTREICENYARQHPEIIRLLPPEKNMGIGANTARTMGKCTGKYIAVCDGDDVWTDPLKLKKQVDFLEKMPDYGVVYTDVTTISETGATIEDPDQERIRKLYASGDLFFKLLTGNFINNSTAVFRRKYLADHIIFRKRSYQIPDHLRWLHISTRAKIHFINEPSTAYRRHSASLSVEVSPDLVEGNRRALQLSLFKAILDFHRHNRRALKLAEKRVIFRKMLSVLYRTPISLKMKVQILWHLPKYFPGFSPLIKLAWSKLSTLFSGSSKNLPVTEVNKSNYERTSKS